MLTSACVPDPPRGGVWTPGLMSLGCAVQGLLLPWVGWGGVGVPAQGASPALDGGGGGCSCLKSLTCGGQRSLHPALAPGASCSGRSVLSPGQASGSGQQGRLRQRGEASEPGVGWGLAEEGAPVWSWSSEAEDVFGSAGRRLGRLEETCVRGYRGRCSGQGSGRRGAPGSGATRERVGPACSSVPSEPRHGTRGQDGAAASLRHRQDLLDREEGVFALVCARVCACVCTCVCLTSRKGPSSAACRLPRVWCGRVSGPKEGPCRRMDPGAGQGTEGLVWADPRHVAG